MPWEQNDPVVQQAASWEQDDPVVAEPDKIGFVGGFIEDPLTKIPFSPYGAVKTASLVQAANRLQSGEYERFATEEQRTERLGGMFGGYRRLHAPTPQSLRAEDTGLITRYLDDLAKKERRGYTLMGRVGQITSAMPAFMVEFLSTGGLQKLGTTTAKAYGKKLLGRYAATTAGKAALATGGFAVGTAVRAAGMPHRASEAILRRQLPQDVKITDAGVEITGPVEKPMTAIWKGLTDHYIEIASEQAGEVIAPMASRLFTELPFIGKLTGALRNQWLRLNPNKTAIDFAKKISTKAGYHGVIGEIGEEYLGNALRAITNVEHFGAGEDADMLERLAAGVRQDTENLPAMAIAFSIPGAARTIPGMIAKRAPVEVAPEVPEKPAPVVEKRKVFHGTSIEAAKRIRATGFKPGAMPGMTGQPIKEFIFVTPYKAGAKWYGEQNVRFKGKYDIVEANLKGKLYKVKESTNEYGAMGIFAKDAGLMKPGEHLLDLPAIANELRKRGYSGIEFRDSVSNRLAYAVLPEQLKVAETKAVTPDEAIGEQYGLTPEETNERLDRAELRYRELKNKPVTDRTNLEKKELAFLKRNRKNIEAILDRDTQPLKPKPKIPTRRKLLAEGHKYPRQLKMTEKERRDFMENITGLRSMKRMSRTQMGEVVDAYRKEAIARGIELDIIQPKKYTEPIVINGRATTMEAIIDEAADTLDDLPTKINVPKYIHKRFFKKIRRSSLAHRLGRLFWGIDNSPLYELTAILEQGKPGIFTEVFDDNIQQGRAIAAGHKRNVSDTFENFCADNAISNQDLAKISQSCNARMFHGLLETLHRGTTIHTIEINNRKYDITPAELLDIYLIARQEDGLRHIYGGGLVINGVKTGKISKDTLTGLLQFISKDNKLMQLVNIISQVGDSIWKPTINNTSLALDKKEIATVENWWGLEVLMPKQLAGKIRKFNINLIENKSILKDRTKATNPLIIRDALQRFTAFENAVSEYVGMADATRIARTVLNDENLSETLRSKGYGPLLKNMHLILERAQSVPPTLGSFDRLIKQTLPGIYRGVLFFNPRVAMSQFTSVTNYQAFVSAKYAALVTKGLSPKAIQRTLDISDIAWDRFYMGHSSLELGELAASDATLRLLTKTSADKNKIGITLRLMDLGALTAGTEIAIEEYKDAQAEKITGASATYWADKNISFKEGSTDWEQAIRTRAEWLWHRSQPSWDKWSRSAITSDPSAIKRLFFLFRSFHEKSLTILHGASTEYTNSSKTLEDKTKFAKKYGAVLSGYTLNTVLRAVIMAGLAGRIKDPFDYLKDLITSPFRMLPILGHILDGSIRAFLNALTKYKSEYRGEAIESLPIEVVNQIARAPVNFSRAVGYYLDGETEKGNKSLKNAVGQVYMGMGLTMGIPVYELNRLYKGWIKTETPNLY